MREQDVYAVVGQEGFERLVQAFYRRVPQDSILGPMYPEDDWKGAEERLRDFLIYRFGGPQKYIAERGHPRLRMRHAPFPIDQSARDRWIQLMEMAFEESNWDSQAASIVKQFFAHMATFLINAEDSH